MIFEMAQNERKTLVKVKWKISVVWTENDYFQWPYYLVKKVWDVWCDFWTNWCRIVKVMHGKLDYRKVAVQLSEKY